MSGFDIVKYRASVKALRALLVKKIELLDQLARAIERDYAAGKLPYQVKEREKALAEAARLAGKA